MEAVSCATNLSERSERWNATSADMPCSKRRIDATFRYGATREREHWRSLYLEHFTSTSSEFWSCPCRQELSYLIREAFPYYHRAFYNKPHSKPSRKRFTCAQNLEAKVEWSKRGEVPTKIHLPATKTDSIANGVSGRIRTLDEHAHMPLRTEYGQGASRAESNMTLWPVPLSCRDRVLDQRFRHLTYASRRQCWCFRTATCAVQGCCRDEVSNDHEPIRTKPAAGNARRDLNLQDLRSLKKNCVAEGIWTKLFWSFRQEAVLYVFRKVKC